MMWSVCLLIVTLASLRSVTALPWSTDNRLRQKVTSLKQVSNSTTTISHTLTVSPRCNASSPEGVSWCNYSNPLIVSDFLSQQAIVSGKWDNDDSNSDDDSSAGSHSNASSPASSTFRLAMQCSEAGQCQAIRVMKTASIGRPFANPEHMGRYVIYVDGDGSLLYVHFNNNSVADSSVIGVQNVTHFDVASIRRIVNFTTGEIEQQAVVLVGNESAVALEVLVGDKSSLSIVGPCTLFTNISIAIKSKMQLVLATFFPQHARNITIPVNMMWIWRQTFNIFGLTDVWGYAIYSVPAPQQTVTDYIRKCPEGTPANAEVGIVLTTPLQVQFFVHHNLVSNITLLVAFTERSVNIYRVTYNGTIEDAHGQKNEIWRMQFFPAYFDWCEPHEIFDFETKTYVMSNRWPTTVYCAPDDHVITAVTAFSPDTWTDIGEWQKAVWLTIALHNPETGSAMLYTFDLREFVNMTDSRTSTPLNPLGLPDSFGTSTFPCDFEADYYNPVSKKCEPRSRNWQPLEAPTPVSILVMRAIEDQSDEQVHSQQAAQEQNDESGDQILTLNVEPHAMIFAAQDRTVSIYSFFNAYYNDNAHYKNDTVSMLTMGFNLTNKLDFIGRITHMHVSENAQHVFTAVSRDLWELESQNRLMDICQRVKTNPHDPFVVSFELLCVLGLNQAVSINSFTQYASYCTFGLYCPTLDLLAVFIPQDAYYAERPAVKKLCPPGSFCTGGQRFDCPAGFVCEAPGTTRPTRCPADLSFATTCFVPGRVHIDMCPLGAVCTVPHMLPILAPPGAMVPPPPTKRDDFIDCDVGDWCPIGRQAWFNGSALLPNGVDCPADTFCQNPADLEPLPCECINGQLFTGDFLLPCLDRMLYCPPRTAEVTWCPAGSYCTEPDKKHDCVPTQYCPDGTFAPQLCPAGTYCPLPNQSIECPKSFFCPRGTLHPVPCNFLTWCPAGSSSQTRSFIAPFVIVVIVFGALISVYVFKRINDRKVGVDAKVLSHVTRDIHDEDDLLGATTTRLAIDLAADTAEVSQATLSNRSMERRPARPTSDASPLLNSSASPTNATFDVPTGRFDAPHITFQNMSLQLTVGSAKGAQVLDNVSGDIPPGSFIAVMGPSGSGKSTFMHTLAGKAFYGNRTGTVTLNGSAVDLTALSKVVGFVKQDDIMLREMTVQETLEFNAKMRRDLAASLPPDEIVEATLKALDLCHVRDIAIGDEKKRGISGGQRKRVNIGMEMVSLPSVLFLDEPTSGLDSTSSMTVCAALRRMAEHGKVTVIAVIHQPRFEIFQLFHKVMFLAKGGKLVYMGEPGIALDYFRNELNLTCPEHVNPPDFFMDSIAGGADGRAANGMTIDAMADLWRQKNNLPSQNAVRDERQGVRPAQSTEIESSREQHLIASFAVSGFDLATAAVHKATPGLVTQTAYYAHRALVQLSRDLVWFFTDLVLVLVAGLFLGLVFSQSQYQPKLPEQIINRSLSAFNSNAPPSLKEFFDRPVDDPIISEASLTCMALGMTGVTAALRVFGNEQVVYWREASAGMSTVAYFVAKNLVHSLFILLSPLLYLAPFLTFVHARASIVSYYRVAVVVQFTTTGLGYLISIVVPPALAQLTGVVCVLVFAMFGGARPTLVQIDEMFPLLRAMPYISYIRWGQEALYLQEINEWASIEGVNVEPSLRLFGYHLSDYSSCLAITFVFGVGFRCLALLGMLLLHREQKY